MYISVCVYLSTGLKYYKITNRSSLSRPLFLLGAPVMPVNLEFAHFRDFGGPNPTFPFESLLFLGPASYKNKHRKASELDGPTLFCPSHSLGLIPPCLDKPISLLLLSYTFPNECLYIYIYSFNIYIYMCVCVCVPLIYIYI